MLLRHKSVKLSNTGIRIIPKIIVIIPKFTLMTDITIDNKIFDMRESKRTFRFENNKNNPDKKIFKKIYRLIHCVTNEL
ncbi:hypothetical protein JPSP56_08350 [Staphylococcus pseudintermedius]